MQLMLSKQCLTGHAPFMHWALVAAEAFWAAYMASVRTIGHSSN